MKICKKCNKINLDSATVCQYCGEHLESDILYGYTIKTYLKSSYIQ